MTWDSPQAPGWLRLLRGGHRAGTDSCGGDLSGKDRKVKGRCIAPCRTDPTASPYRFLLEVGLLQHHRLGLAEPVPGALWVLGAQLHSAPLWSHNQRQLLAGAL